MTLARPTSPHHRMPRRLSRRAPVGPATPFRARPSVLGPVVAAAAVATVAVVVTASGSTSTQSATPTSAVVPGASSTSGPAGAPDPNAVEEVAPGDIPDNQVFVPYTMAGGAYSVDVPEGWSRTEDSMGATFTDNYNSVRLEVRSGAASPTVDSVRADEVPSLASTIPGFQLGDVAAVTRPAGDGVVTTYTAHSDPNPVTGKAALLDVERYELWHSGATAVLTLSGAHGADNVDPWKTVTTSLAWA